MATATKTRNKKSGALRRRGPIPSKRTINLATLGEKPVRMGLAIPGIILILLAVSIFLISNTVRVGISVRAEEIGIMKYIGATDFFVRAPFVLEGIMIGLIGAVIPLALIYYLYDYVLNMLKTRFEMLSSMLSFLSVNEIFNVLAPMAILIAVGMGFLGSFVTVRKYLKV